MIVAGLGFRAEASETDLAVALTQAGPAPDLLATLAARAGAPALIGLAQRLGLRVVALPESALAGMPTPTRSARILDRFGTGSVAEAAALVAAGPGARLIRTRIVAGPVTIALAATAEDDDTTMEGKAR